MLSPFYSCFPVARISLLLSGRITCLERHVRSSKLLGVGDHGGATFLDSLVNGDRKARAREGLDRRRHLRKEFTRVQHFFSLGRHPPAFRYRGHDSCRLALEKLES